MGLDKMRFVRKLVPQLATLAWSAASCGGSGGANNGAGTTTTGAANSGVASFHVVDPVPDHALRSGESPTNFSHRTILIGASRDRSVVFGSSDFIGLHPAAILSNEVFRWTEATGVVGLGFAPSFDTTDRRASFSGARLMSADGSTVIVESSQDPILKWFHWTEATGLVSLGTVSGATDLDITAVSGDGAVLTGKVGTGGQDEAIRWTASGITRLGSSPGTRTAKVSM